MIRLKSSQVFNLTGGVKMWYYCYKLNLEILYVYNRIVEGLFCMFQVGVGFLPVKHADPVQYGAPV